MTEKRVLQLQDSLHNLKVLFVYMSTFTNLKRIGRLILIRDVITGDLAKPFWLKLHQNQYFSARSLRFDGLSFSWWKSLCQIIQGWRWEGIGEDGVLRNSAKKGGHMVKYWVSDTIFIDTATDIIQLDNTDITHRDINIQAGKGMSVTISLISINFFPKYCKVGIFLILFSLKGLLSEP